MAKKINQPTKPAGYLDRPITAGDIVTYLDRQYNGDPWRGEWVGFAEFRPGTGFAECSNKYIDFWAINCFGGQGYTKLSYEIKVSRSDFMHEIKNAAKRKMALLISNLYYFAAPLGLIKPEDLPPEAGLVEYYWRSNQPDIDRIIETNKRVAEIEALGGTYAIKPDHPLYPHRYARAFDVPEYKEELVSVTTVKAPHREHMVPGWKFIAAACRRSRDEKAKRDKERDQIRQDAEHWRQLQRQGIAQAIDEE